MSGLDRVLWIGGAQWAGKSTTARYLGVRYPVVVYAYDFHDARSHATRARRDPDRFPAFSAFLTDLERDPNLVWVDPSPEEMADQAVRIQEERFALVLEDLAAVPEGSFVVAEGWGIRPELVAPLLDQAEQSLFLVPTEGFRDRQLQALGRAQAMRLPGLHDPVRAQANRLERDAILGRRVLAQARELGLPVVEVDGSADEWATAARAERQFSPFLPRWLYAPGT